MAITPSPYIWTTEAEAVARDRAIGPEQVHFDKIVDRTPAREDRNPGAADLLFAPVPLLVSHGRQ